MDQLHIKLQAGKKAYFISDLHLGMFPYDKSRLREKTIVSWLDAIAADAQVLFLLGDVFDFWYEYKKVAPRGFVRFLGKLAELSDKGIDIHYFTGNHDVWVFDYLPAEIGLTLHRDPVMCSIGETKMILGHGDGVGAGDRGYKMLKSFFTNKLAQWMFSRLHPNFAFWLGHSWSKHSRLAKGVSIEFLGAEKEFQVRYARAVLETQHVDYFVFGHRHYPIDFDLGKQSHLINLGEWIQAKTYAVFDGKNMQLLEFK
jgi:UDP-2,3-diacylglucosamine hydrolase